MVRVLWLGDRVSKQVNSIMKKKLPESIAWQNEKTALYVTRYPSYGHLYEKEECVNT